MKERMEERETLKKLRRGYLRSMSIVSTDLQKPQEDG